MLLTLLGEAHAQGLGGTDPVGFAPTPAGAFDDALRVPRAELGAPTVAVLMVGSGEASNPTAASVWGTARLPVGESASAAVAWGGHSVFEGGGGVADLHLSAPMVHHRGDGWVLGSAPFFEVPLGGAGVRGSGGGGVRALGTLDLRGLRVDGALGFRLGPSAMPPGPNSGAALLASAAATLALGDEAALVLEHDARAGRGPVAAESAVSGRACFLGLGWTVGAAVGWTETPGVVPFRSFLGVSLGLPRREHAPDDVDDDGLVGDADTCPDDAETFDGVADDDGCPEWPVSVTVEPRGFRGGALTDADIQLDAPARWSEGATYDLAVSHPRYRPVEFRDVPLAEGRTLVLLDLDPLPAQVLIRATDGLGRPADAQVTLAPAGRAAFDLGADGRETFRLAPGDYVATLTAPGRQSEERLLTVGPAEVVEAHFVLHDAQLGFTDGALTWSTEWLFVDGGDELRRDGLGALDQLANLLTTRPELERVAIRVYVDPTPDPEALHLTQRRANNVAAYLIGRGVAANRLSARGGGGSTDGPRVEFTLAP